MGELVKTFWTTILIGLTVYYTCWQGRAEPVEDFGARLKMIAIEINKLDTSWKATDDNRFSILKAKADV